MAITQTESNLEEELDAFVAGDASVDRHALFERLRHDAPVIFNERLGAWVVSRYDDVKAILQDEARFSTLREGPGAPVYGPAMLQWRGREHQKKGGIVARRLRSKRAVGEADDYVRQVARRLADDLVLRDGTVDLKTDYAMWIPLLVIGELLDIDGAERFRDWYHDISAGGVSSIGHPEKRERAFEALAQLGEFLDPIITARRTDPGDDLLSDLCVATYDDEPLPFEQIRAMTAFLLTAGVETTERALSSLFVYLFTDPERWQVLRDRPDMVTAACAETLRIFPPVHAVTRMALEDVEIAGETVSEGDRLVPLLASGNRDETVFDDPHTFNLERFADDAERQFTNAGYTLPFGAGRHHCTGSQLARIEMVHGIEELLERVRSATFVGGVPEPEGFLLVSPAAVPVTIQRA